MNDRTMLFIFFELIGVSCLIGSYFAWHMIDFCILILFGFASVLQGVIIKFKSNQKGDFWDKILKGKWREDEQTEQTDE